MRHPTKGGKLDIMDMIDKVVESEGKWMDMDVSTITSFPEDDDLLMLEDTKEDSFQYDDNPTQADSMFSNTLHNLENILNSEKTPDGKMLMMLQVDWAVIGERHQDDGKEGTSQTSDELEWDDTTLEEQTQAELNGKMTLHAHLARYETTTQVAQSKQCQMSNEDEAEVMLRKDNRRMSTKQKPNVSRLHARSSYLRNNASQSSTDSNTELVAESTATIHQSNTRSGRNPTNKSWTLQQAIEGVSLPVFHNTLPRKYLY